MPDRLKPVVIIGAGLAGLACAMTLKKNKKPYLVIDKLDSVGGRIQTLKTEDGFLLDHGFQVLLTSYPELKNFIDLERLNLSIFHSGTILYTEEKNHLLGNPLSNPGQIMSTILSSVASIKDKLLVLALVIKCKTSSAGDFEKMTTLEFLKEFGFSHHFIQNFWTPFLAGVYLDCSLQVDASFFMFLMNNFSTGRVALPANGMQAIPKQMAENLDPQFLKLNTAASEIHKNHVVLESGEIIQAENVVCAFNSLPESNLNYQSVTNYYFSTTEILDWDRWLVLVPPHIGLAINNLTLMNKVSSSYSESGKNLISVSLICKVDPGLDVVQKEICQIARKKMDLKFIKKFVIKKALPKKYTPVNYLIDQDIYYCGDHLVNPSINGALQSGRVLGEALSRLPKNG